MNTVADTNGKPSVRRPTAREEQLKREALSLWEADRMRLMLHQPFVAMLAMRLDLIPVVDDRLATACTDGERIFVNARFLHGLSPFDRVFVLAHEVWHCAARHPLRRGRREARRWNIAADHEVNALLHDEGLRLPRDCIYFPEMHGRNAEVVYASSLCDELDDTERGDLADDHEPDTSLESGVQDPDFDAFSLSGDWDNWPARVVAVAQQIERIHGELPGNIHRFVDAYRKPQVPWREVLSQFVTRTLGDERVWLPPHRRWISRGLYLPSRRGQKLEATVAIDTSGSTSGYLSLFLGELIGLAASFGRYRLRLLLCDFEIQQELVLTDETPWEPEQLDFQGGGGTSFLPVFRHLEESDAPPSALIFFTDGFGRAPRRAPPYPVLWAITPDGIPPVRWGECLRLPEERHIAHTVQGRYA